MTYNISMDMARENNELNVGYLHQSDIQNVDAVYECPPKYVTCTYSVHGRYLRKRILYIHHLLTFICTVPVDKNTGMRFNTYLDNFKVKIWLLILTN